MFGWGRRRRHTPGDEPEAPYHGGEHADEVVEEGVAPGPYDVSEAPDDEVERLDLGSVRLPVPEGSQLQVEVDPAGPVRAVHLVTDVGRLTVSAFAAPKSDVLWPEVSKELMRQLREDGAKVRTESGEWGSELVADTPDATLRFVGVDGPRWLLRGVAAGPGEHSGACTKRLYELIEDAIVVRGDEPLPVRTPLPIELPEAIAQHIQHEQQMQNS